MPSLPRFYIDHDEEITLCLGEAARVDFTREGDEIEFPVEMPRWVERALHKLMKLSKSGPESPQDEYPDGLSSGFVLYLCHDMRCELVREDPGWNLAIEHRGFEGRPIDRIELHNESGDALSGASRVVEVINAFLGWMKRTTYGTGRLGVATGRAIGQA